MAFKDIGAYFCYCASQDTRVSYGWCPLIQGYFCVVENYAEKAELSNCSWYPKRKFGVTMHFSERIKLQFGKKCHTLLYILLFFRIIYCCLIISKKMHGYPQFSFWISIALAKICFPRIVINHTKILLYLVGTLLNRNTNILEWVFV